MNDLCPDDLTMTIDSVFKKLRTLSREQAVIRIHPSVPSVDDILLFMRRAQAEPVVNDDGSGIDELERFVKASFKEPDLKVAYYFGMLTIILEMLPCRKRRMSVRLFD